MRQLLITTTLLAVGLSMAYSGKSALERVSENISQENDEEGETQQQLQENNVIDRLHEEMDDRMEELEKRRRRLVQSRKTEKYRLGQSGTMNCPEGLQLVTNEHECRESAPILGKSFKRVGCFLTEIPGCLDNGDAIWFSTCKNTHHHRHVSVCKESLWPGQRKVCANYEKSGDVSNQEQCQKNCLADVSCGGILYSYEEGVAHQCYKCSTPVYLNPSYGSSRFYQKRE